MFVLPMILFGFDALEFVLSEVLGYLFFSERIHASTTMTIGKLFCLLIGFAMDGSGWRRIFCLLLFESTRIEGYLQDIFGMIRLVFPRFFQMGSIQSSFPFGWDWFEWKRFMNQYFFPGLTMNLMDLAWIGYYSKGRRHKKNILFSPVVVVDQSNLFQASKQAQFSRQCSTYSFDGWRRQQIFLSNNNNSKPKINHFGVCEYVCSTWRGDTTSSTEKTNQRQFASSSSKFFLLFCQLIGILRKKMATIWSNLDSLWWSRQTQD